MIDSGTAEALVKLKELLDTGILNQEEYDEQKKILISKGVPPAQPSNPSQQQQASPGASNVIINNTIGVPLGAMKTPKSKWTAFLLCFFLGYLGAHKFYEGKIGTGIFYLVTVGFCGIMWVIDTIVLLTKSDPYYV